MNPNSRHDLLIELNIYYFPRYFWAAVADVPIALKTSFNCSLLTSNCFDYWSTCQSSLTLIVIASGGFLLKSSLIVKKLLVNKSKGKPFINKKITDFHKQK